ncbi:hypothetical protein C8Q74DRAFT_1451481 [Fomes fomentarius]|nr:hypothetical protein C8Q74DRAFT_1451481 [Fomes fomentarius]
MRVPQPRIYPRMAFSSPSVTTSIPFYSHRLLSMSSDESNDLEQEILEAYGRLAVENYCIIASSMLLWADSIFTFTEEIQRIWGRKFTGATLIFLLTRWVAVAERIVLVTSVVLQTVQDKSCVPPMRMDDTLTDVSYLMFGVFMMLRMRGVWGGSWIPVILIGILTPIRPIISMYLQIHYTPIAFGEPLYGCGSVFSVDQTVYTRLGIVSRATGIAIDAIVLTLTWYKTYGIKRESGRLGMHTPYATLLLREGTLYFLIILLVQLLGIISVTVGSDFPVFIVWPYFDQVFTVIFLTRFMLNLRGVYLSNDASSATSISGFLRDRDPTATISGIHFSSSVVGNMGAPLKSFPLSLGSDSVDSYTAHSSRTRFSDKHAGVPVEWDTEDETLETSSDPLFAGLREPEVVAGATGGFPVSQNSV